MSLFTVLVISWVSMTFAAISVTSCSPSPPAMLQPTPGCRLQEHQIEVVHPGTAKPQQQEVTEMDAWLKCQLLLQSGMSAEQVRKAPPAVRCLIRRERRHGSCHGLKSCRALQWWQPSCSSFCFLSSTATEHWTRLPG